MIFESEFLNRYKAFVKNPYNFLKKTMTPSLMKTLYKHHIHYANLAGKLILDNQSNMSPRDKNDARILLPDNISRKITWN